MTQIRLDRTTPINNETPVNLKEIAERIKGETTPPLFGNGESVTFTTSNMDLEALLATMANAINDKSEDMMKSHLDSFWNGAMKEIKDKAIASQQDMEALNTIAQKTQELQGLSPKIAAQQTVVNDAQNAVNKQQGVVDKLTEDLKNATTDKERAAIQEKLTEANSKLETLNGTLQNEKTKLDNLNKQASGLNNAINEANKVINNNAAIMASFMKSLEGNFPELFELLSKNQPVETDEKLAETIAMTPVEIFQKAMELNRREFQDAIAMGRIEKI